MGHHLRGRESLVDVNAVMRVKRGWQGVHEPRGRGGEAGY
jgi:gamma-glutamyltranspeptidase/glutathione hydrolase